MRGFAIREGDGVRLVTPFDKAFIEALKRAVPHRYREYDPESRSWLVETPYEQTAISVASRHYDSIEEIGGSLAHQHAPTVCLDTVKRRYPDHAELGVMPDAPAEVTTAAYRALVRLHHPDLNGAGGHERTVRLNLAYQRLGR